MSPPYSDDLQTRFNKVIPEGFKPPRLYRIVARNESFFTGLVDNGTLGLTGLFDRHVLAPRLRELLILRTCVAAGNDYEWHLHVDPGLSRHMGLTDTESADTRSDSPAEPTWSPAERVALELVDSLVQQITVSDDLFTRLREHYDEATLIEMTQLIGWHTTVLGRACRRRTAVGTGNDHHRARPSGRFQCHTTETWAGDPCADSRGRSEYRRMQAEDADDEAH